MPINGSSSFLTLNDYTLSLKSPRVSPKDAQETCAQWHLPITSVLRESEGGGSQFSVSAEREGGEREDIDTCVEAVRKSLVLNFVL